jgi:Skp family chaperone for outer membrane proteins
MRREMLLGVVSLLMLGVVLAAEPQAPAATPPKEAPVTQAAAGTPGTRVAVIHFQRAVIENSEGKKAQDRFMGEVNKREKEIVDKQKSMTEAQTKLQNGEKTLSDNAKADLAKQIDRAQIDLQRMNDDAQKELGELQQSLFRPIADRTQKVLQSYSNENGFAVVFDVSGEGTPIIHWQEVADITTEIIRRVDADAAKTPAAPAKPAADPAKK